MHLAAMLGHRFSILTVLDQLVHVDENKAAAYGLAGARALGALGGGTGARPGGGGGRRPHRRALAEQALGAVRDDGAHVLVLGCTCMPGLAGALSAELADAGVTGVPVIDPLSATLQVAVALARGGLAHSKRSYPDPPAKDRPGYGGLGLAPAGLGSQHRSGASRGPGVSRCPQPSPSPSGSRHEDDVLPGPAGPVAGGGQVTVCLCCCRGPGWPGRPQRWRSAQ